MGIVRRNVQLKNISGGLTLPRGYRKSLLEGFAEDRRRRQRDREKESKLRSARLAGKTAVSVFKRDEHVRVPLVREVATELRSLVMHRGCGIQEFCSNILEELVWLWRLYPNDLVLYLRRCDPAESEVAVRLDFVRTSRIPR